MGMHTNGLTTRRSKKGLDSLLVVYILLATLLLFSLL